MSTPESLLSWESAYDGYQETPVNKTIFALMAGHSDGEPWCATFQVAAMISTGTPIPPGGASAYCPTMLGAFQRAGRTFDTPQVGDLGFVYYATDRRVGHVFAVRAVDEAGRAVQTWEGNTAQDRSPSGGMVASLWRSYGQKSGTAYIAAFARPAYDGVAGTIANLPVKATHTGALVVPAVLKTAPGTGALLVDGDLGPATITALQKLLGVPVDGALGPVTITRLQKVLNAAIGANVTVDGVIDMSGPGGSETVRALQAYLGTPRDGIISSPFSDVVAALQRRLNAGTLFSVLRA